MHSPVLAPITLYRHAHCKHIAAVEDAACDVSLDAFPADDDEESSENDNETRVIGPFVGHDKYGHFDHHYWRREHCRAETTDKRALANCC